jgi:hypothetical protein
MLVNLIASAHSNASIFTPFPRYVRIPMNIYIFTLLPVIVFPRLDMHQLAFVVLELCDGCLV